MLIRVVVKNLFSFGEEREFNMLPAPRHSRFSHHKYKVNGVSVLKQAILYGANGAGKSNLIKALSLLQGFALGEKSAFDLYSFKHKFSEEDSPVILGCEHIRGGKVYFYVVEIQGNVVLTEELYISGLGQEPDELVFKRKTDLLGKSKLQFQSGFGSDVERKVLQSVVEKNFVKPDESIFFVLTELDSLFFEDVRHALMFYRSSLRIILPDSEIDVLIQKMDSDRNFRQFVLETTQTLQTGISDLKIKSILLEEYLGTNERKLFQKTTNDLRNISDGEYQLVKLGEETINVIKEENKLWVKLLELKHENRGSLDPIFWISEESDGTIRLLQFLSLFYDILRIRGVFIVDEIERSIHPALIKKLIEKFSKNENTAGQLICTSHESQLLDQEIFRQDEIWFAEKDKNGCTDLYPLSDFKEHHTKSIQRGYLNGRYGAIPFLGDLDKLNWNQHAPVE